MGEWCEVSSLLPSGRGHGRLGCEFRNRLPVEPSGEGAVVEESGNVRTCPERAGRRGLPIDDAGLCRNLFISTYKKHKQKASFDSRLSCYPSHPRKHSPSSNRGSPTRKFRQLWEPPRAS